MNINELIEHGKLSGITIDKDAGQTFQEATKVNRNLKAKVNTLKEQRQELDNSDVEKSAASKIAEGASLSQVQSLITSKVNKLNSLTELILALETAEIPKTEQVLAGAESALQRSINTELMEARKEMERQFEDTIMERVKLLNESRTGIVNTTPPAKQSESRICVCESCKQEIAVIGKNIVRPVNGTMFLPLGRQDLPPFIPQAEIEFFKCKNCGKRPFGEFGKILTNAGYFVVPELKDEDMEVAETA